MAPVADVKWIKITTDIFDDEKILLIESLPDPYAIITVWFKLLCLAGKQNNSGVFMMGQIAYTDKMLATIFRMNEATVSMALKVFEQFGMVEIIDGVITIPNWGKHQNLDQLESKKEYMRNYMKDYREKQKLLTSKTSCKTNSKANVSQADKEEDKEIEEEKEEDKDKKKRKDNPPTVYYPFDECLNQAFVDYVEMRKRIKKPLATERAITLAMNKLDDLSGGDNDVAIQILEQSIMNSWQGLFPLKQTSNQDSKKQSSKSVYDEWRNA